MGRGAVVGLGERRIITRPATGDQRGGDPSRWKAAGFLLESCDIPSGLRSMPCRGVAPGRGGSHQGDESHFEQGIRGQPELRRDARGAHRGLQCRGTGRGRQGSHGPRDGTAARLRLRRVRERRGRAALHRAAQRAGPEGPPAARERGREPAAPPRGRTRLLEAGAQPAASPAPAAAASPAPAAGTAGAAIARARRPPSSLRPGRWKRAVAGASARSPTRSPPGR